MNSNLKLLVGLTGAALLGLSVPTADAQSAGQSRSTPQRIKSDGGGLFMEEEQTPSSQGRDVLQPKVNVINERSATRQQVNDNAGNDFMDEVTESTNRNKPRVPIDLRNTNVQVDPKGHIIPMINRNAGPVQYQYNSGLQAYQEMPVPTIAPSYANPLAMPFDAYGRPAAAGTAFVPVAPGTIPGIRSMNLPPGYYYGNNFGYLPYTQTQYSGNYSQTSLTGDSAEMLMPMFRNFNR